VNKSTTRQGLRVVEPQLQGLVAIREREFELLVRGCARPAAHAEGVGVVTLQLNCRVVVLDRVIEIALVAISVGTISEGLPKIRPQTDRLVEILNRPVILVLVNIGIAAATVGVGVVGLQLDRSIEILDRQIIGALSCVSDATSVVCGREVGPKTDRLIVVLERKVMLALLIVRVGLFRRSVKIDLAARASFQGLWPWTNRNPP